MTYPTWIRTLLAMSLALNLGVVAALLLRPALMAPPAAPAPAVINLPDYLKLTPQQRQRWQALEPEFLHELSANWSAIGHHREALVRQIFAPMPDRQAINAEQAAIAQLQAAQQQRVIAQLLAERELLDEDQRTQLLQLLLSRYSRDATDEELLHRK